MKRLIADSSSDNDDDINITKIKNKFKKSKKPKLNNHSKTNVKNDKVSKKEPASKQMTLDAFTKAKAKSEPKKTIDNYFQRKPKQQEQIKEISVSDYFKNYDMKKEKTIGNSPDKTFISKNDDDVLTNISFDDEELKKPSPIKHIKGEMESNAKSAYKPIKSPIKTPTKTNAANISLGTPNSASKSNFHAYINRAKPAALGSKEIPAGNPNCLIGLTFVISGVLDSIERDDAQLLIERHGGRVTKAVSGKTTYLVVGNEPGESKINKAKQNKTKIINEDELFDLIRKSSNAVEKTLGNNKPMEKKSQKNPTTSATHSALSSKPIVISTNKISSTSPQSQSQSSKVIEIPKHATNKCTELFVDKYRPKTMTQIIGQQGAASAANKLYSWLRDWYTFYKEGFKSTSGSEERKFRAALLSGPPGIGKTTTAHVVAKELGYDIVELNASSTRSKGKLMSIMPDTLDNQLFSFNITANNKKCLIMDEVDGMAGNEDRGGINQLIQSIKTARHPIICICNDRNSQKLRSFIHYVYDLQFRRPTVLQIKAAILSMADKEQIKIPSEVLEPIIAASNQDLRQVFNNIQMWSIGRMDADTLKLDANSAQKDLKLKPFDVCNRVFSHEGCVTYSDKSNLFFQDYQLGGLFVQENYMSVRPYKAKGDAKKTMRLMSLAADSIAMGDIVGSVLRKNNQWGLLPTQALFASVIPGEYLHGRINSQIRFPNWLGKNSSTRKNERILYNISNHLRLSTHGGVGSPTILMTDYGSLLVRRLIGPLREGDIETVVNRLKELQLLRDDIDLLVDLVTKWTSTSGGGKDIKSLVSSQIRANLTRAYNKAGIKVPYSIIDAKTAASKSVAVVYEELDEGGESDGDNNNETTGDDIGKDSMIQQKKVTKKRSSSKSNTSKSKKVKLAK